MKDVFIENNVYCSDVEISKLFVLVYTCLIPEISYQPREFLHAEFRVLIKMKVSLNNSEN